MKGINVSSEIVSSSRAERSGVEGSRCVTFKLTSLGMTDSLAEYAQARDFKHERFLRRRIELIAHFFQPPNAFENIGRL
jgi:hypothetical protein